MPVRDLRRMDHLTWPEFDARKDTHALIVPLGAVEQHGYHMPLGVDGQLPFQLALAAAAQFPAIVAPPLWYGYKSQPRSGAAACSPAPPASTAKPSPAACAISCGIWPARATTPSPC